MSTQIDIVFSRTFSLLHLRKLSVYWEMPYLTAYNVLFTFPYDLYPMGHTIHYVLPESSTVVCI
jgi:hypothetical protein